MHSNVFSIDCLLSTDVRTPSLFFCRFHNARLIHLLVYEVGISQKKKKIGARGILLLDSIVVYLVNQHWGSTMLVVHKYLIYLLSVWIIQISHRDFVRTSFWKMYMPEICRLLHEIYILLHCDLMLEFHLFFGEMAESQK